MIEQVTVKKMDQAKENPSIDLDGLVNQLSLDLDGKVDSQAIRQVVADVLLSYQDAQVQTYVSIFVRRDAMEILRLQKLRKAL